MKQRNTHKPTKRVWKWRVEIGFVNLIFWFLNGFSFYLEQIKLPRKHFYFHLP